MEATEAMRTEPNIRIESLRRIHPELGASDHGRNWGWFICHAGGMALQCLSSGVDTLHGWEHVSVSVRGKSRCPTWAQMCYVKSLFWADEETVVQFHPKESEYVNQHPYVLHLWKQLEKEYELPPQETVGVSQ